MEFFEKIQHRIFVCHFPLSSSIYSIFGFFKDISHIVCACGTKKGDAGEKKIISKFHQFRAVCGAIPLCKVVSVESWDRGQKTKSTQKFVFVSHVSFVEATSSRCWFACSALHCRVVYFARHGLNKIFAIYAIA